VSPRPGETHGATYLAICGVGLLLSGITACAIALTVQLLPYDVRFLGMSAQDLCGLHGCRIVHFMVHDRISFGGSLMATGAIYVWLAKVPLARGEAWAFWALSASGAIGFASFLSYLGFGYLDVWHERATLLLLVLFVGGLVRAYPRLMAPRSPAALLSPSMRRYVGGRLALGRTLLLFTAGGMVAGGLTIVALGMTRVFVPQDLEFMQVRVIDLVSVNPRLVPLIAHDRAGFGGALASCGVAIGATAWCAVRAAERALFWVLAFAGGIGFACAIGVHPWVGYISLSHLLPALLGASTFVVGMVLLSRPMLAPAS
jgi:hypothetical protein